MALGSPVVGHSRWWEDSSRGQRWSECYGRSSFDHRPALNGDIVGAVADVVAESPLGRV